MNNSYIDNEVNKIIKESDYTTPLSYAMAAAWLVANFKGVNLKVIDVSEKSSLADYFVIGSVQNIVQAQSTAGEVSKQLKKHGLLPRSKEGLSDSQWVLLDFGDIIVHLFLDHSREIFDLDTLWNDCPHIEIPQEYYFSHEPEELADKTENYF